VGRQIQLMPSPEPITRRTEREPKRAPLSPD
jgi:hypothetical protein